MAVNEAAVGLGQRQPIAVTATVEGRGGAALRCAPVTVTVTLTVPSVRLPFDLGEIGTREVRAAHTERIDPYRSGLEGEVSC